jgi:hypothetical protein
MIAYDDWVFRRVEAMLLWLEEWCSISQKAAERAMIVGYVFLFLSMASVQHALMVALVQYPFALIITYFMWSIHRTPAAARWGPHAPDGLKRLRVLMQVFLLSLGALSIALQPRHISSYADFLRQADYVLFYYSCQIGSNGERGRRRKLALAELKKMFGTAWIPKPIEVS